VEGLTVASWSLILAALVVGITICVAIGYIVFLQPNPESNVPDLPPSDAVVETPPDETSSTSLSLSPSSKPENASDANSKRAAFLNPMNRRKGDRVPCRDDRHAQHLLLRARK
jgi:hypothetical protein